MPQINTNEHVIFSLEQKIYNLKLLLNFNPSNQRDQLASFSKRDLEVANNKNL